MRLSLIYLGKRIRVRRELWSNDIRGTRKLNIIRSGRMMIGKRVFRLLKFWIIWVWYLAWTTSRISK